MIALERNLAPDEVHARVREAHRLRRTGERALAFYLKEVERRGLWEELGFADVFHYARVVADLAPKTTADFLRVAERLETLPRLADGYASGDIAWSKVREISRVATRENEGDWIEEASRLSCRAVEDLVARARRTDTPEEARRRPAGEGIGRESVPFVLHLRPEVHAMLTEAIDACRRMTNGRSLEEAVVAFAEIVLHNDEAQRAMQEGCMVLTEPETDGEGKPNPALSTENRPSFQVVLYRCEACGSAKVQSGDLPASKSLVERSECDAEIVDLEDGGRVSRTIPARVRRAVVLRDGGKCQVPGCRNRLWTDCHHIVWRSRGGSDTEDNIVLACTRHHAAIHEGLLTVEREGRELRWRHRGGVEFGRFSHVGGLAGAVAAGATDGRRARVAAARGEALATVG